MTDQQHPIVFPATLLQKLVNEEGGLVAGHLATQAARWGADTELEACVKWLIENHNTRWAIELRAARRPKPPSDKELALEALQSMRIDPELIKIINGNTDLKAKYDTIRRALKALPND